MIKIYVVIGVSGSGKTTIGKLLADRLEIPFQDADDFHPESNKAKMARGEALGDNDREPWLQALAEALKRLYEKGGGVLACSALKEQYREQLCAQLPEGISGKPMQPQWIVLHGEKQLIATRLKNRGNHFFDPLLLESQWDTWEFPNYGWFMDIQRTTESLVNEFLALSHKKASLGVIGLGTMGQGLARNLGRNQYSLALFNRSTPTEQQVAVRCVSSFPELTHARPFDDLFSFIEALEKPRKILLMVSAGAAVDELIRQLQPRLETGDVLLECGNSHFEETAERVRELESHGIHFLGVGVSGGAQGALEGPAIMPGGSKKGYDVVEHILLDMAARDPQGRPCCAYVGPEGAGHFVKMVHNGIEYAEMQLLAECYGLVRFGAGWSVEEVQKLFMSWLETAERSYLLEITIDILGFKDPEDANTLLLDQIADQASQKGTGGWSTTAALNLGQPFGIISESVMARYLSAQKELRVELSKSVPRSVAGIEIDHEQLFNTYQSVRRLNHAQGFALIQKAAQTFGWAIDPAVLARIWSAGCIIRSTFMERLESMLRENSEDLLQQHAILAILTKNDSDFRNLVSQTLQHGLPMPVSSAALNYWLGLGQANSAAHLIQAQRDYFGAHGYQRKDDPTGQLFYTLWNSN
ncbi:NADP-dependent phosphogluconate dehydrogenase [Croceiramulus getboli]|nr:NADP-dependent phosphogluconate dehydrogenase [Flavobacteriaceae bacterium YJPT1-3]